MLKRMIKKSLLLFILLGLTLVLLFSCYDPYSGYIYVAPPVITFEEVSSSYRSQYGTPEEVQEFISGDYHTIDWWWWCQGFEVSFINSPYDDVYGWDVQSTYSFSPICF